MNPHDVSTELIFVLDALVDMEPVAMGATVHAPTWSGTLTGLATGCYVRVTDRTGRTETYHPSLFNLTVSAMAPCGCSVTDGVVTRSPYCYGLGPDHEP